MNTSLLNVEWEEPRMNTNRREFARVKTVLLSPRLDFNLCSFVAMRGSFLAAFRIIWRGVLGPGFLYGRLVHLFEFVHGPQPQHPHSPRRTLHSAGDFLKRQSLQVSQDDYLPILRPQFGELIGQGDRCLAPPDWRARRWPGVGKNVAEIHGGAIERRTHLLNRDFSTDIPPFRLHMGVNQMVQAIDQYLS
jgi:hypothetical protein